VELAAVDDPRDHLAHVIGRAHVGPGRCRKAPRIVLRRARLAQRQVMLRWRGPRCDDIAHDRQRVLVVLGQVVDHARLARVQIAAAQILGADDLARRRLHQRRTGEEDRALFAHDDVSSDIAGT
jgi:hypothetical protein